MSNTFVINMQNRWNRRRQIEEVVSTPSRIMFDIIFKNKWSLANEKSERSERSGTFFVLL